MRLPDVTLVSMNIITIEMTLPDTVRRSLTAYFCMATKMKPTFFKTKLPSVKPIATSVALRRLSPLTAWVLKKLQ